MQDNFSNSFSLTHLDGQGQAQIVDVSSKIATIRQAVATGKVRML
ncbi:MAG: cyclic pyranopterin monophosphate synthase MoaC, partial [Aphanizomenon sp.]